mgnify:CR=1 FL=1
MHVKIKSRLEKPKGFRKKGKKEGLNYELQQIEFIGKKKQDV